MSKSPRFLIWIAIQDIVVIASGMKSVISNKRFIHSPAEKNPELYDLSLVVSENQIEVFRSGIIDKTEMYEAVDSFGMKYAIWVKYPPSLFHYNYSM